MPTLKKINAAAGTNFRRTKELVAALNPPAPPPTPPEPPAPLPGPTFTVEYHDGALFIDGPYDAAKFYRIMVLSANANPIQDLNPEWAGWPFIWSPNNFPDNPPPPPPFAWAIQVENYLSRQWRSRRQYPADYKETWYKGEIP